METLNLNARSGSLGLEQRRYHRRAFFVLALGGFGAYRLVSRDAEAEAGQTPKKVKIAEFDATGQRIGVTEVEKIRKPDADWKKQLTPDQFEVTRHKDTERAFTGKYYNFHGDGIYHCVCCGTPLFDSKTKFESGTGWPSFYEPIAKENVHDSSDLSFGVRRTEVTCSRCDAHLGHVFEDGPPPTGLRYCMNSASLNFTERGKQTTSE